MPIRDFVEHPFSRKKRDGVRRERTAQAIKKIDRELAKIKDYMVDADSPMGGYYTLRQWNLLDRRDELTGESNSPRKRRWRG